MARFTLGEAADRLGVSTKTIRRRIKQGTIHADFEDGRYYIPGTEVDRVASEVTKVDDQRVDRVGRLTTAVTIPREEWDALMARFGFLEAQQQLLIEHKEGAEAKERALEETRSRLLEAVKENRMLKLTFWLFIGGLALGTFVMGAVILLRT